jgi:hypothetical protein
LAIQFGNSERELDITRQQLDGILAKLSVQQNTKPKILEQLDEDYRVRTTIWIRTRKVFIFSF